ncbi:MAG TPA: hypothetical protein VK642_05470 [Burkholderiales bacterium]|nr:hypothetical protein [Burkholderiales bacterium]
MKSINNLLFALGLASAGVSLAITGGSVDVALRGDWVPVKAACTSPLKVIVEANKVTFVNGTQQVSYTKLDQCFSCAGRDVKNVIWLSTDAMGDSPFIIHFNTAKKQAEHVDFSNDKKLAARFPLGTGPLKKCG